MTRGFALGLFVVCGMVAGCPSPKTVEEGSSSSSGGTGLSSGGGSGQVGSSAAASTQSGSGTSMVSGSHSATASSTMASSADPCASLGCASQHRVCMSSGVPACGACVMGYAEGTPGGACVPNNGCGPNMAALPGSDGGNACVSCNCDAQQDPGLTGDYWPTASPSENRCVCVTKPGYFFHRLGVAYPCDADGDGWLRVAAKTYMERPPTDPERLSAKCGDLVDGVHYPRTIDHFVLENEAGTPAQVVPVDPTPLYEPDTIDDPVLLSHGAPADFPVYGTSRGLLAQEINPLTKACINRLADLNQNQVADYAEWQDIGSPSVFQQFSYFIELYRGRYSPPAAGESHGAYHIKEKSRAAGSQDGDHVPVVGALGGSYWRECARKEDQMFQATNGVTNDFCRAQGGGGIDCHGMLHASQFKCVEIVATLGTGETAKPNQWTADRIGMLPLAAGYTNTFNACSITGSPVAPSPLTVNPWDAPITCAEDTLTVGKVGFVTVGFKVDQDGDGVADPYNYAADYVRGCVDECKETMLSCPACRATQVMEDCPGYVSNMQGTGPDPNLSRSTCGEDSGALGYGKLVCGCSRNLGGPSCEIGCPEEQLHTKRSLSANLDGNGTGRTGYWMCGELTGSSYPAGQSSLSAGGYTLRGKVPMAPLSATPLTGGGYTLR